MDRADLASMCPRLSQRATNATLIQSCRSLLSSSVTPNADHVALPLLLRVQRPACLNRTSGMTAFLQTGYVVRVP